MVTKKDSKQGIPRPPVVAVLGHVDHGKTTLLDTIRKTHVAQGEHGGITQHIGAYQISLPSHGRDQASSVTFIDTPGHEAFSKMRSRGAKVADIAVLVVAADDSVMPQTKESIRQIKEAGIPMIVAINKIDTAGANSQKVKQDLAKEGVQVEGFGGEVPFVEVSAKAGTNIQNLLDLILLVSGMEEIQSDETSPYTGIVIETRLDKGKGIVATVVGKTGIITRGMELFEGNTKIAKIRAMFDENGIAVLSAGPSKPVEILGFTSHPHVGQTVSVASQKPLVIETIKTTSDKPHIPEFLRPLSETEQQKLFIVLKADTAGSLEAIKSTIDPRIQIVGTGIGTISEADILLAKPTRAFVIGFNVAEPPAVLKLAQAEKVIVRSYSIIYELLDELGEVVEGMKELILKERVLGTGTIIAEFPFNGQRIAGTKVLDGRFARGDTVKIMRNDEELVRSKIKSLRHGKADVSKVDKGDECGILFDKNVDFLLNDVIIAITLV